MAKAVHFETTSNAPVNNISEQKQEPQPSKSPILRISQKKLTEMFERGEAKLVFKDIPLEKIVEEFNTSPHTPDLYTRTFSAIWRERAAKLYLKEKIDIHSIFSPCPYTQEEIIKLEQERRRLSYLPKDLAAQET